jgi:hypothetical protein
VALVELPRKKNLAMTSNESYDIKIDFLFNKTVIVSGALVETGGDALSIRFFKNHDVTDGHQKNRSGHGQKIEVEKSNMHNLLSSRPGTTQIMSFDLAQPRSAHSQRRGLIAPPHSPAPQASELVQRRSAHVL